MDLGVDFANYTRAPTPRQLQCWWDSGVRFAIIGCRRADVAASQLWALNADGRFGIEAYQYYLCDDEDEPGTEGALGLMREASCRRPWVDVEWTTHRGRTGSRAGAAAHWRFRPANRIAGT